MHFGDRFLLTHDTELQPGFHCMDLYVAAEVDVSKGTCPQSAGTLLDGNAQLKRRQVPSAITA